MSTAEQGDDQVERPRGSETTDHVRPGTAAAISRPRQPVGRAVVELGVGQRRRPRRPRRRRRGSGAPARRTARCSRSWPAPVRGVVPPLSELGALGRRSSTSPSPTGCVGSAAARGQQPHQLGAPARRRWPRSNRSVAYSRTRRPVGAPSSSGARAGRSVRSNLAGPAGTGTGAGAPTRQADRRPAPPVVLRGTSIRPGTAGGGPRTAPGSAPRPAARTAGPGGRRRPGRCPGPGPAARRRWGRRTSRCAAPGC